MNKNKEIYRVFDISNKIANKMIKKHGKENQILFLLQHLSELENNIIQMNGGDFNHDEFCENIAKVLISMKIYSIISGTSYSMSVDFFINNYDDDNYNQEYGLRTLCSKICDLQSFIYKSLRMKGEYEKNNLSIKKQTKLEEKNNNIVQLIMNSIIICIYSIIINNDNSYQKILAYFNEISKIYSNKMNIRKIP